MTGMTLSLPCVLIENLYIIYQVKLNSSHFIRKTVACTLDRNLVFIEVFTKR
jgi:hypothetical protein